jgi:hypothetical protein
MLILPLELYDCLDIDDATLNPRQKEVLMEIRWLWECMIQDISAAKNDILIKLGKDMILARNTKLKKMMEV